MAEAKSPGWARGCGTHMWDADVAGFGNRRPHLPDPNVERNRPPQDTFLLSKEIYRPHNNNPPRDTEVTCSAHLQTYGSVFFVLCSLYFIVFCIVIVQFDCFHCIERVWCFIVLNECLRPQTVLRLVAFCVSVCARPPRRGAGAP